MNAWVGAGRVGAGEVAVSEAGVVVKWMVAKGVTDGVPTAWVVAMLGAIEQMVGEWELEEPESVRGADEGCAAK